MMNPQMQGKPQGMPQESMGGAVPQAQAMQGPAQGQKLSPEEMDALRNDPEIVQGIAKFIGRPVDMRKIPDDMLITIAGMVHKLGVDGAIAEFRRLVPPEQLQKMRFGAEGTTNHPRRDANGIPI